MSRRLERWRGQLEADLPEVVVCRGGDCGSRRKHPRFDHVGQLTRIREELGDDVATVTASKCLDACVFSNVVVLVPGRRARDLGAEPAWIGEVLDDDTTGAVIDWARTGGTAAEMPAGITPHRFEPDLRSRHDLAARRGSRRRAR